MQFVGRGPVFSAVLATDSASSDVASANRGKRALEREKKKEKSSRPCPCPHAHARVIRIPATCAAGTDVHSGCEMLPRGRARASPVPCQVAPKYPPWAAQVQQRYPQPGAGAPNQTRRLAFPTSGGYWVLAVAVCGTGRGRGGCP